jgi:hypothetical protein
MGVVVGRGGDIFSLRTLGTLLFMCSLNQSENQPFSAQCLFNSQRRRHLPQRMSTQSCLLQATEIHTTQNPRLLRHLHALQIPGDIGGIKDLR